MCVVSLSVVLCQNLVISINVIVVIVITTSATFFYEFYYYYNIIIQWIVRPLMDVSFRNVPDVLARYELTWEKDLLLQPNEPWVCRILVKRGYLQIQRGLSREDFFLVFYFSFCSFFGGVYFFLAFVGYFAVFFGVYFVYFHHPFFLKVLTKAFIFMWS